MNSFTLEASFHGFLTQERETIEFTTDQFEKMVSFDIYLCTGRSTWRDAL